jgi:uncharacterized protein
MKPNVSQWLTAALLLVFSSACFAQLASYPRSKGPVSDYAGKLSQAQIAELTSLIEEYQRQSSIEIAVVVVDTLQGQSAREYAMGIGNSWGVGKADRDNGVILLWAPNERAYSLRIADGLSQDLSDADATEITRNNLLPNFRQGEYFQGLKDTVGAVMRRLGNENWEERLQLRQQKDQSVLTWLVPALVAGLAIFAVVVLVIYRRGKHNLKLRKMAAVPDSVAQNLRLAQQNAALIQQLLDEFKKQMPEQDLTRFTSELAEQPARLAKINTDLANLDVADVSCYAEVLRAKGRAQEEANLLSNTQGKLDELRQAKVQSQLIMQRLSNEKFQIADVRDGSRRAEVENLLSSSRLLYDQAHQNSSMSLVDWIMINQLLASSQRQVQQAVQVSQAQPYTSPPVFDSGSTSTFDASSSGNSGDFGCSTSTFDASSSVNSGDFGGGGGFSGGSGSDGSY